MDDLKSVGGNDGANLVENWTRKSACRGFIIEPFPWSREGGQNSGSRSRKQQTIHHGSGDFEAESDAFGLLDPRPPAVVSRAAAAWHAAACAAGADSPRRKRATRSSDCLPCAHNDNGGAAAPNQSNLPIAELLDADCCVQFSLKKLAHLEGKEVLGLKDFEKALQQSKSESDGNASFIHGRAPA